MPTPQNRNNRNGQDQTLIIPHITKEMLEVARSMAEHGASRAEIEQAIAAMQQQSGQTQPPAQPEPQPKTHRPSFIPTRRPRYSEEQRRAMQEQMQRQQGGMFSLPKDAPKPTTAPRDLPTRPKAAPQQPHPTARKSAPTPAETSAAAAAALAAPAAAKPAERKHKAPAARTADTAPVPAQPTARTAPVAKAEAPTQVLPTAPAARPKPAAEAEPQPMQQQELPAQPAHKRTNTVPRSKSEAEADLNERIRSDHIWLSNPVLVRGLGLAPIVGAALDGERALMLCVASLILVTFTRVLAVAVCHLTGNRFRPVVYCYSAALVYIPTYILLYALFGADLTLLGIYLPILTVEPAIVKRMEFSELESVPEAMRHGFNNALGMCVALLLVGCLREFLAEGSIFGQVLMRTPLLPLAALPAGGFVLVGLLAAGWCAAANLYTDYKREEVQRLYANRKH